MKLYDVLEQITRVMTAINAGTYDGPMPIDGMITIARAGLQAYQYRFTADKTRRLGYRLEGRRWMDGTEQTPTSGTETGYVGWARWSASFGFTPDSVLADDWRFVP